MKYAILILSLLSLLSCKQEEQIEEPKAQRFADVDTSSNEVVHMSDMDDMYYSLDEVVESHKGKLVYLDIWASWCAPCTQEMPASLELQEKYKDSDVAFIYLSIDRNNKAWENGVAKYGIEKNSYLARNYPKANLFQENAVRTIPRYMLFDKTGRLIDGDADRPSSKEISQVIDAFLSI